MNAESEGKGKIFWYWKRSGFRLQSEQNRPMTFEQALVA